MLSDKRFNKMMRKAREQDAEMARLEAKTGTASPQRCDLHAHLRTVEQALECAVRTNDWQVVCEGIVMLQSAITRTVPVSAYEQRTH